MALAATAIDWRAQALQQQLAAATPGLRVEALASVDSTSTRLLERCRSHTQAHPGEPSGAAFVPILLVADQQTAGRGRQGRSWTAQAGASLTFSLAWPMRRADLSGLSLAVGVALADSLADSLADALDAPGAAPARLGLKWPNDLWLLGAPGETPQIGRKLGGVLIETVIRGEQRIAVLGIGLNVMPLAVQNASSGVAWLGELDPRLDAPQVLHRVAPALVRALRLFEADGFGAFEARFAARDLLFGRHVVAGTLHGVAQGVASNGALRLRCGAAPDAPVQEIVAGEVSVGLDPTPRALARSSPC